MGKAGPKPQPGKREPNGRLSREMVEKESRTKARIDTEEWDAMYVALSARWRVHGIPLKEVRNQMAGSFIGRLCLNGELTRLQWDAAQTWLEQRQAYHHAIAAPREVGAIDINAVHGRGGAENEARSIKAVKDWDKMEKAVRECQSQIGNRGNLFAALDLCVARDNFLPHMVGDLRTALNAIARHCKLGAREAA